MTRWRGLPTRPSWSSVSDTCRTPLALLLPCCPFKMRATRLGVGAWLPSMTPRGKPTTWVGRSLHAIRPARELPTPGGHAGWLILAPMPGAVRPLGGGQGPPHQRVRKGNRDLL
jgi:hypothetical protein